GGVPCSNVSRWNGAVWGPLGSGTDGGVFALAAMPNGDLVAGGEFATAGGTACSHVARWNGTAWSALGAGTDGGVFALATMPNGDLVAAGDFATAGGVACSHVARWNGSAWSALGAGTSDRVIALAVSANGDLLAGGDFTTAGGVACGRVARWNGTAWSALGAGTNDRVSVLTVSANGDLVAGGAFTAAGGSACSRVARWDGMSWVPLGAGADSDVLALATLSNGDLVAGGTFTTAGGAPSNGIARWDGSTWSAFGAGVVGQLAYRGPGPSVHALATLPDGDLVAGGAFLLAGGEPAVDVAWLTTPCPATAATIPTPCIGPAGPVTLVADTLPWCGSTFATTARGFAPNAVEVGLVGFSQPNLPLSVLTPLALPGCDQLASQEAVWFALPSAGSAVHALPIPNAAALAGVQLFQQSLQAELSPQGLLATLSASNGLRVTVGIF
ncbi:MAG: hypothetical protein KDE27_12690, partial [Planctomycetes bacterium]|nr:hypothetical protein [Planctomycetota bacterium]